MTNVTPAFRRLAFSGSLAALTLLLGGTTAALAQARIEDCEKIQAADAYNQCLAKFGPTSKVKELAPAKPGDIKGSGDEAAVQGADEGVHASSRTGWGWGATASGARRSGGVASRTSASQASSRPSTA